MLGLLGNLFGALDSLAVAGMLFAASTYALLYIGFRLIAWADSAPPEFPQIRGLCDCAIDPMAGVYGHCGHKLPRLPELEYVPRHAA